MFTNPSSSPNRYIDRIRNLPMYVRGYMVVTHCGTIVRCGTTTKHSQFTPCTTQKYCGFVSRVRQVTLGIAVFMPLLTTNELQCMTSHNATQYTL